MARSYDWVRSWVHKKYFLITMCQPDWNSCKLEYEKDFLRRVALSLLINFKILSFLAR